MGRVVYVRWLTPYDARAVARLERKAYRRSQRDGRRAIEDDLYDAYVDDRNLSAAMFDGAKLVAYILAYIREDRREIFEDFEVHCEQAEGLGGRSIYVEDIVALPNYMSRSGLLYSKWKREVRRLDSTMPMDAFCSDELRRRWNRHRRMFRRLGFELGETQRVRDLTSDQEWFWMSWNQIADPPAPAGSTGLPGTPLESADLPSGMRARLIQTPEAWARIADDWNRLLDRMPEGSGIMSYEYLNSWWAHFGISNQLSIHVLYRGNEVIGIAPMMIAPKRILGVYRPRLEFIGDQVNTDTPDLIVDESQADIRSLVWRCVMTSIPRFDAIYLREQEGDAESHAISTAVRPGEFTLTASESMDSPYVMFDHTWDEYLAARSRALRKGFRSKLRKLNALGELRFHGYKGGANAAANLAKFLDIESRSWKAKEEMGVSGNSARLSFYHSLMTTLGSADKIHFRFLSLDGKPIAGTIGLIRNGRFESLEICHDQAFDRFSPGVVLTGLELEECFGLSEYREYNFLVGTYANKTPWQTHARSVRDMYTLPRNVWGYANRALIFWLKPRVKRFLKRHRLMESAEKLVDKLEGVFR